MNEAEKERIKLELRQAWRRRGAGDPELVKMIAPMMKRLCDERGIPNNFYQIIDDDRRKR